MKSNTRYIHIEFTSQKKVKHKTKEEEDEKRDDP